MASVTNDNAAFFPDSASRVSNFVSDSKFYAAAGVIRDGLFADGAIFWRAATP
jgi:hypothetical protein